MKRTGYYEYTRLRPDRSRIKEEWIRQAIDTPDEEQVQADGRVRRWTWVPEEGRFLRVVLLEDGETVHNAFFDRRHKQKESDS